MRDPVNRAALGAPPEPAVAAVKCPFCHQPKGVVCVTPMGRPRPPHKERYHIATRTLADHAKLAGWNRACEG